MNMNEINSIVSNYDKLIELTKQKIEVISKLYKKYHTYKGVIEITIEDGIVDVRCDDSYRGSNDEEYFNFPLEWLSKSDEELTEIVLNEKLNDEESKRKEKEAKDLALKQKNEQAEFQKYLTLKAKFEN